jgi:hypothetical protein
LNNHSMFKHLLPLMIYKDVSKFISTFFHFMSQLQLNYMGARL